MNAYTRSLHGKPHAIWTRGLLYPLALHRNDLRHNKYNRKATANMLFRTLEHIEVLHVCDNSIVMLSVTTTVLLDTYFIYIF